MKHQTVLEIARGTNCEQLVNIGEGYRHSNNFSVSLNLLQNNELKTKGVTNLCVSALMIANSMDFEPISSVK